MMEYELTSEILNDIYGAMLSANLPHQNRSLGSPAPFRELDESEEATGDFFICLRVPPGSDETYADVFYKFKSWLEDEVEKDIADGFPACVKFSAVFQIGKFSPGLLTRIRSRPEVAYVSADTCVKNFYA